MSPHSGRIPWKPLSGMPEEAEKWARPGYDQVVAQWREARQLMAYAYIRNGLPPPVIRAADRDAYIDALEAADGGNLRPLTEALADLATPTLRRAVRAAERALNGNHRIHHPNGGVTNNGRYYPPEPGPR